MDFLVKKEIFKSEDFFVFMPNSQRILSVNVELNISPNDILNVDEQKNIIYKNTLSFAKKGCASNILLWGARGMGKSSLVKCIVKHINEISNKKVKLIEFLNNGLDCLPDIVFDLSKINNNFIIFIDDITFSSTDKDFKLFKTLVDGSILSNIKNVKYYVTSNLRHLSLKEREGYREDDLTKKEANTNIISLSDRFGCWVGFYENNKENYLKIVDHYLKKAKNMNNDEISIKAVEWAIGKGNFSGRTAYQFVQNIITQ